MSAVLLLAAGALLQSSVSFPDKAFQDLYERAAVREGAEACERSGAEALDAAVAAARAGRGGDAVQALRLFADEHGEEVGAGFARAVREMLVSGGDGEIRVFPAVPTMDWEWCGRTVSFSNLVVDGGHCVSATRLGDGAVTGTVVGAPEGPVTVLMPEGRRQRLRLKKGVPVPFGVRLFDVRDFGARCDGKAKDTEAIQKAVDAAQAAGGGEVRLPAGTYLTGTVFLKSNVDFNLLRGALLLGSTDPEDYCRTDAYPQNMESRMENASGGHLVVCVGQTNVTLRGYGRIDGRGDHFLTHGFDPSRIGKVSAKNDFGEANGQDAIRWRPGMMLHFAESADVRLEGLEIFNSPYWSVYFHGCERVRIAGLSVYTSRQHPSIDNGDGISIDCSRHVTVCDCDVFTKDDALCLRASAGRKLLRSPAETAFVTVSNCTFSSMQDAIRIGVGEGRIHDCVFRDIRIRNSRHGINFSATWSRSAGVSFEDISFDGVVSRTWMSFLRLHRLMARDSAVRGIRFANVRAEQGDDSYVWARDGAPFRDISFRNVSMDGRLEVVGVEGLSVRDSSVDVVRPTGELLRKRYADIENNRNLLR